MGEIIKALIIVFLVLLIVLVLKFILTTGDLKTFEMKRSKKNLKISGTFYKRKRQLTV